MSFNRPQLYRDGKKLDKPSDPNKNPNKSIMGYRDDSPYKNQPYIDIYTPNGVIDMTHTGAPILADGKILPPYSGEHQFDKTVIREFPLMDDGGEYTETELTDEEIAYYRSLGYKIEEVQ